MNLLLSVAFAVLAGLMMTRVVKKLGLPDVTAYLVAGVLIGPYALGRLNLPVGFHTLEAVEGLNLMSDVALGFIAFAIGNEFRLSALKKTGKQATIVGIVQGLVAALFVDAALIGLHFILGDKLPISSAITLGAIAAAMGNIADDSELAEKLSRGALEIRQTHGREKICGQYRDYILSVIEKRKSQ